MNQFRAQAITIARTEYGEADRIVTFLTQERGKIRAMAKGVRKPKSKLAGGIELFSISDLTFIKGKGELHTLVSSRLKTHFADIVKDIDRTMLGYEILKILNRVLEDEGGEEYYELLKDSLSVLNNLKAPVNVCEASFLMRLMALLGHEPNLTTDIKGQKIEKDSHYQFSFDDMGFFEAEHGPFTQNHIKLLRLLGHNKPEVILGIKDVDGFTGELINLIRNMSRQYVVTF